MHCLPTMLLLQRQVPKANQKNIYMNNLTLFTRVNTKQLNSGFEKGIVQ